MLHLLGYFLHKSRWFLVLRINIKKCIFVPIKVWVIVWRSWGWEQVLWFHFHDQVMANIDLVGLYEGVSQTLTMGRGYVKIYLSLGFYTERTVNKVKRMSWAKNKQIVMVITLLWWLNLRHKITCSPNVTMMLSFHSLSIELNFDHVMIQSAFNCVYD